MNKLIFALPCFNVKTTPMQQLHLKKTSPSKLRFIAITALIAGTLDITAACVQSYLVSGRTPDFVLKFVASGVWGTDAFSGGTGIVVAGLIFHFFIALSWTILFFAVYNSLKLYRLHTVLAGVSYGIFVWLLMNLVVLPLSNTPPLSFSWKGSPISAAIIVVAIGLPIAYGAAAFYKQGGVRAES